jgi:hypothetical protein
MYKLGFANFNLPHDGGVYIFFSSPSLISLAHSFISSFDTIKNFEASIFTT